MRLSKYEEQLENDRIYRKIKAMFKLPKWKKQFKEEFYIIEAKKIKTARLEEEFPVFMAKAKLRIYK